MTEQLTRDQAIALAGLEAVERVERENCEPTNRVGYNGACQGDPSTEWRASISIGEDDDGFARALSAYYYTTRQDDEIMAANDGDGASINWTIDHYTVS